MIVWMIHAFTILCVFVIVVSYIYNEFRGLK